MISRPLPPSARLAFLRAVTIIIFIVFAGQLWRIQVIQGEGLRARADRNRFRLVEVRGPRGVIYDRNGQLLVRNTPSFSIAVVPADLPSDPEEARRILLELEKIIAKYESRSVLPGVEQIGEGIEPAGEEGDGQGEAEPAALGAFGAPAFRKRLSIDEILKEANDAWQGGAFQPLIVADRVDRETAFAVAEESYRLAGVVLSIEPVRQYLSSTLTSHVLGYMGPIPQEYVESYRAEGYRPNDQVGLAGLELTFEKALRGVDGRRNIEVDVNGREVRTVGDIFPSEPGHNLVLTLDLDLQALMDEALREGLEKIKEKAHSGVVIAMNPQNGEILGMVSLPAYDNNLFAHGITPQDYEALINDKTRPLVNHAISSIYPPGSVFKIVPASAALQEGVIDERTRLGDSFDGRVDGIIWVANRHFPDNPNYAQPFYCWIHTYGTGHYRVNVREALAVSCDIFFYQISGGYQKTFEGLNDDRLIAYSELFGFGAPTGVDLPGEHRGLVPTPRWKRLTYAESWVAGDTYNMSIGQGAMLATPLQVVNATAAIANGGLLYRPQIVSKIVDVDGNLVEEFKPELIRELPIDPEYIAVVQEGLWAAVNFPNGTAKDLSVPGVQVAGKTGTAEFYDPDIPVPASNKLPTHAWFTAYAPYENPEIVLAVFVYNGGEGSVTALPIAEKVLRGYFNLKALRAGEPLPGTEPLEMPWEEEAQLEASEEGQG